jgi:hypothetical protein
VTVRDSHHLFVPAGYIPVVDDMIRSESLCPCQFGVRR